MNSLRSWVRCASLARRSTTLNYLGKRCISRTLAPTITELVRRKRIAGPEPEAARSSYLEWNRDAELYAFNTRLKEKFDVDLLLRAFVFRSYILQEERKQREAGIEDPGLDVTDNQDLLETGARLTKQIVKAYLCRALPRAPEECVRALLDYLTSQEILAQASSSIGTKDLVLTEEFPVSENTLACTFYTLVAALAHSPAVDSVHVANFVRDFLIACLSEKELCEIWRPSDPEGVLNGILARENREIAEPRLIGEAGTRSMLAAYRVGFYSNREFLGSGFGESVEEAREAAAVAALCRMFGLEDSSRPIRFDFTIDVTSDDTRMENVPLARWSGKSIEESMPR